MKINTTKFPNSTVKSIYAKKDKIDIEPSYQRNGGLWNEQKQQKFLDSIFNGFDIPKIYYHEFNQSKKIRGKLKTHAIIDGRQRLETIWGFIGNTLPLGDFQLTKLTPPKSLEGYYFDDLGKNYPELKSFFNRYELPIMKVKISDEQEQDDLISEMFLRLNEGVNLTAPEKRNAIGGKLVNLIKKLAKHEFFKTKIKISNQRYAHYEITARLLFTEHIIQKGNTADTHKRFLDKFARDYKKKLPDDDIETRIKSVFDSMTNIFYEKDSFLVRQSRIPLFYLLAREAKKQNKLRNVKRESIQDFYNLVKENTEAAKTSTKLVENDLTRFADLSKQGTNDPGNLKQRFHIMASYLDIDSSRIDELKSVVRR